MDLLFRSFSIVFSFLNAHGNLKIWNENWHRIISELPYRLGLGFKDLGHLISALHPFRCGYFGRFWHKRNYKEIRDSLCLWSGPIKPISWPRIKRDMLFLFQGIFFQKPGMEVFLDEKAGEKLSLTFLAFPSFYCLFEVCVSWLNFSLIGL